jgi:type II secretion system protein N
MNFSLSPRAKRILRWVGYPLLALVSFLFMFQLTFPYDRAVDRFKDGLAAKYIVTVGSVDRGFWPGSVTLSSVTLHPRPTKAGEEPTPIFIKEVSLSVKMLDLLDVPALIRGKVAVQISASVGNGTISGAVRLAGGKLAGVTMTIDDVAAGTVPGLAGVVGLPVGGKLDGEVDFDLADGDARQAEGKVSISCKADCTIGDGVAKIYPKARPGSAAAAFGAQGMTVAKLLLHDWSAEMTLSKGKLDLAKFDFHSDDGEIFADFHAQIQKTLKDSPVTGCIKFKASEVLKKREPKFGNGLDVTGAPLGPDNYYYVKLTGTLGDVKRRPEICSLDGSVVPGTTKSDTSVIDSSGRVVTRPRITPSADEAIRPTPTIPPPVAPPPEVAPPPPPPPSEGQPAAGGTIPPPVQQQFERRSPPPSGDTPPPPPGAEPPRPGDTPPADHPPPATGDGAPIIVN